MSTHLTTRLLLLVLALVTTGCGQKGPLYLPDKPEQSPESDNNESPES